MAQIKRTWSVEEKESILKDIEKTGVVEGCRKHGIFHEFTKPATPEQNGYIESFHSSVEKLVCARYEFDCLAEAQEVFA